MQNLNSKLFEKNAVLKVDNVGLNIQSYLLEEICAKIDAQDIIFITKDRIEGQKIFNTINFLIRRKCLFFPEWDIAPYEHISPAQNLLHQRIRTLFDIINSSEPKIIVASTRSVLQKIPTKNFLQSKSFSLRVGDVIERDKLIKDLVNIGYVRTSFVTTVGEFAIRGSIIDIAGETVSHGYRIDFFGDQIESIRKFDVISQITSESKPSINIFPSNELIISTDTIENFKNYLLESIGTGYKENRMLLDIQDGIKTLGVENFLPVFYQNLGDIFGYLKNPVIVLDNFVRIDVKKFLDKAQAIYQDQIGEGKGTEYKFLAPEKIWLSLKEFENKTKNNYLVEFYPFDSSDSVSENDGVFSTKSEIKSLPIFHKKELSFGLIKEFIIEHRKLGKTVIISCLSEGSQDRIMKMFGSHDIEALKLDDWPNQDLIKQTAKIYNQVFVIISPIEHGAICPNYIILTEEDLFGEKIKKPISKKTTLNNVLSTDQGFQIGEIVVHKEYGIGKFVGLELIKLSDSQHDCLKIIYAGDDKLFVPVENMDVVVKYGSASDSIILDSLERASWQVKKERAKNKIRKIADYLLKIAAQRNLEQADKITLAESNYNKFCASFPYAETEDQEKTINSVLADLASGRPMDRLICGDTGVGKTEIAIRAAFVATQSQLDCFHKNLVVLICPTTLLCRQHYKVFKERFKNLNIKIFQLSRLVSSKEKKQVIEEINQGKVDIVIGTHALLTDKIDYRNLTLLIVDEEHHFGVSHKEKLKKLKEKIHILTLSATPIPRTLQMSLAGIRDLNLITTPPVNRIATKISVIGFDESVIKEALIRERNRGGQSFYICPRIHELADVENNLKVLLPNFKIVKAHGRLPVSQLDKIMEDFYEGKFDVLLSTSIIESGLDIPKANTIIVHNANKFGLAQLYQIKGRVGRSNVESYAYFTVQDMHTLNQVTMKKLQILQNLDELGAGFSVASHDMDIRGFGNLLGEEQSGHIKEIGVELYQQMLEETLSELKAQGSYKKSWVPQINIDMPILIPEAYIADFDLRLSLYKKASNFTTESELIAFSAELIDRFGALPSELEGLLAVLRLKQLCLKTFVKKINLGNKGILIEFVDTKEQAVAEKLFKFVMNNKEKIKLKNNGSIVLMVEIQEQMKRIEAVKEFLESYAHCI
ncbi:MAG: transcription-repair coupling factor [Rickettsiales bacterium]|nr:transcription-repair coupling factor [Rickettsiales bacterium]